METKVFEVLCIDKDGKTKIKSEKSLKYAVMFNEKIWEDVKENVNDPNASVIDEAKGVQIKIKQVDTAEAFNVFIESAFIIKAKCSSSSLETFRYDFVEHLKQLKFDPIYVLVDELSMEIADKIYPKINKVENLLRKYLIKFFVTKLGPDWWNMTTDVNMKQKVNARKDNEAVFSRIVDIGAYLVDFGDLGKIVYSKSAGFNDRDDVISKVLNVDNLESLNSLKVELQSNYNKFFKETFQDKGFKSKWEELEKIRNKVAHNNLFIQKDYERAVEITDDLLKIIKEADSKIDSISFSIDEKIAIRDAEIVTMPPNCKIISEEELLAELVDSEFRAERSQGFVGLRNFVANILEKKNYAVGPAYSLINILSHQGLIEIYDIENNGVNVKAIRRIK